MASLSNSVPSCGIPTFAFGSFSVQGQLAGHIPDSVVGSIGSGISMHFMTNASLGGFWYVFKFDIDSLLQHPDSFELCHLIVDTDLIAILASLHISNLAIVFLQDPKLFVNYGFSYYGH
jgi:hypothetical protein